MPDAGGAGAGGGAENGDENSKEADVSGNHAAVLLAVLQLLPSAAPKTVVIYLCMSALFTFCTENNSIYKPIKIP
jgi:hypothetical protein